MKKKMVVSILTVGVFLFGGVVGASSTTLHNGVEGLKGYYQNEYSEWSDNIAHEMGVYEENKYVEIEEFSSEYFEKKKEEVMKNKIDEEFEKKKQEMKDHIDALFSE